MTRQEAIKILSILKAAYPNAYKGMTKEEANGTISIWATQFSNIPLSVVSIAVNKLISTNIFPPSISEVKEKIRSLYWEAWNMLNAHETAINEGIGSKLDERSLATVKEILKVCEPMRTRINIEPSLESLISGFNSYLAAPDQQSLN